MPFRREMSLRRTACWELQSRSAAVRRGSARLWPSANGVGAESPLRKALRNPAAVPVPKQAGTDRLTSGENQNKVSVPLLRPQVGSPCSCVYSQSSACSYSDGRAGREGLKRNKTPSMQPSSPARP